MNNIDPKIWGRQAWDFLFYVALSYPDVPTYDEKNIMRQFLTNIGQVLPCITCRYNYSNNMKKYPISDTSINSRYNLISWLLTIHNEIRLSQGKSIISYNEALDRYMNQSNEYCFTINCSAGTIMTLLIIFIIFALLVLLKMRK